LFFAYLSEYLTRADATRRAFFQELVKHNFIYMATGSAHLSSSNWKIGNILLWSFFKIIICKDLEIINGLRFIKNTDFVILHYNDACNFLITNVINVLMESNES
jgi:hypothetical protein